MRNLVLIFVAMLFAGAALQAGGTAQPSEAAGAVLAFPTSTCSDASTAPVAFSWTPAPGATQVWLDVSPTDNGFAAGSFDSAGPLAGNVNSYTWPGLTDGQPYVWRVNSQTATGWVTSETNAFVPCGSPAVIAGTPNCTDAANPFVTVRWAPMSPAATQQFLDFGYDQNFGAGTFGSSTALNASMQSYQFKTAANATYVYFRVNELWGNGSWYTSPVSYVYGGCGAAAATPAYNGPAIDTSLRTSNDTLVIKSLGINAPVNTRNVGPDGIMDDPAGKDDVVRYDFPALPGYGGYPGKGGTTVVAGHVDYHPHFEAVFWTLKQAQAGTQIDYYRADGTVVSFQVDWVSNVGGEDSIGSYIAATSPETMLLISCEGSFTANVGAEGGHYNNRTMVHAVRIS